MRLPLNLAREPMRHDRAILIGSAAIGLLLCISLVALISLVVTDRHSVEESRRVIDQVQKQMLKINAAQTQIDAQMRQPQNASLLYRSELYNTLILRKSISWTKIFSDLTTVLPYNVRIISIRPQLNARNQLALDMVVSADAPEPVIGYIVKLEGSNLFGDVTQTSQIPPTQTDQFYRFHLTVTYDQKL